MPDVREKLVGLLKKIGPSIWYGDCEGHRHPMCDNICCAECIANRLITNGVTIQRWIPVEERLPETADRYLCNVKSFAFPGRYYQAILHYDKYGFREGNIYTDDVTHWMPLPEPPKGDE